MRPYTTDLTEALEDRDYLLQCLVWGLSWQSRERLMEALREVDEVILILQREQAT